MELEKEEKFNPKSRKRKERKTSQQSRNWRELPQIEKGWKNLTRSGVKLDTFC